MHRFHRNIWWLSCIFHGMWLTTFWGCPLSSNIRHGNYKKEMLTKGKQIEDQTAHVTNIWKTDYLEHFHGIMPHDKKDNGAQHRRRQRRKTFDCIVKQNYFCLCVWLLKLSACKCSWCPLDFWPPVLFFGFCCDYLQLAQARKVWRNLASWQQTYCSRIGS